MTPPEKKIRRRIVAALTVFVAAFGGLWLARLPLVASVVSATLARAGATEVKFAVTDASPWLLRMEHVGLRYRTQAFSAREVRFERPHWWSSTLGHARVREARVPLVIDGSGAKASDATGAAGAPPAALPVDAVSVDGQLVIQAAGLPEQALTVALNARTGDGRRWGGDVEAHGPGVAIMASGGYDFASHGMEFRLHHAGVDLTQWREFLQRIVALPDHTWQIGGQFTASAEGKFDGKELAATARVQWREGSVRHAVAGVEIEGIEADVQFTDLDDFRSTAGPARARKLVAGGLTLTDVEGSLEFAGRDAVSVHRATFNTLGGKVTAEPFKVAFNRPELSTTLSLDGIDVEQVLALTDKVPGRATGRVDGRLAVGVDENGLRLGTGWLELKKGVHAEMQFNADGLLTRGMDANSPSFAVMKKIESGLLHLKVGEMRLEVRPPNAPAGRSATLRVAGEPTDPEVKAPVKLDLNVNGPLETLLNIGLNARVRTGVR
jgi:hypothetical protein